MTTRYVWKDSAQDDGDATWNSSTLAYLTLQAAMSASAAGDIILVETTHTESTAGAVTLSGKASNPAYNVFRVDKSDSDSYDPDGVTWNISTTGTNYISIRYGVGLYGLRFDSTSELSPTGDTDSSSFFKDVHFRLGINQDCRYSNGVVFAVDCTWDSNDVSNSGTQILYFGTSAETHRLINNTFGGGLAQRNVIVSGNGPVHAEFVGCDFSALTRNPTYLASAGANQNIAFIDCKLPPDYLPFSTNDARKCIDLIRCNGTDEIERHCETGSAIAEASIIRTGGAAKSWECVTTGFCGSTSAFYTPWIYGVADAAESKNFDIHFAHSGSRLTEEEIFMELELMDSAGVPYGTMVSSQKRAVLGDSVGNANTASEVWGGSETYEEFLRITQTVGVANSIVRARIGIEKTSQTDEVYIDPFLEIS